MSVNVLMLQKVVTALDKTWHPEHFFCAQCGAFFGPEGIIDTSTMTPYTSCCGQITSKSQIQKQPEIYLLVVRNVYILLTKNGESS